MIPSSTLSIIMNIVPMVLLFAVVAILLRVVVASYNKEKIHVFSEFKILMYLLYLFVLFQLVTTTDLQSFSNNFTPFKEIMRYEISSPLFWRNVIGNILIFAPFSYLITDVIWMFSKHRNIFISLAFTILTSCSIESIQMFIGRSFDIDDIILNSLGGLVGYIAFVIIKKLLKDEGLIVNIIKFILFIGMMAGICFWVYTAII